MKKYVKSFISKMDNADFVYYNFFRLVMVCYIGWLYGVVLMLMEFLVSCLIDLFFLSRDLYWKKFFKMINVGIVLIFGEIICL